MKNADIQVGDLIEIYSYTYLCVRQTGGFPLMLNLKTLRLDDVWYSPTMFSEIDIYRDGTLIWSRGKQKLIGPATPGGSTTKI